MIKDSLKLKGELTIVVTGADGKVKEKRHEDNLVVTTGLNYICSRMVDASATVMSHIGLGSGTTTPAAGDTDLQSILGTRQALSSSTAENNTVVYSVAFPAGVATGAVTEAGIFNALSSGTMLCRTTFPVVNKEADDTIAITWTITLSAS